MKNRKQNQNNVEILPLKMTGRNPQVWSRWSGTVTDSTGARGCEDPIDKHPDAPLSAEDKQIHTYIIIADILESSQRAHTHILNNHRPQKQSQYYISQWFLTWSASKFARGTLTCFEAKKTFNAKKTLISRDAPNGRPVIISFDSIHCQKLKITWLQDVRNSNDFFWITPTIWQ